MNKKTQKTNWLQKFLLILSAVIITALILESVLRLAGGILLVYQDKMNAKKFAQQDSYRIMCVGESTTFLGGDGSYPAQLQEILNTQKQTKKKFTVINKGVPGIGTSYIVNHLEEWIQTYHPNIVVVMMGANDNNERIPVDEYSTRQGAWSFLKKSRLYKLGSWISKSIRSGRATPAKTVIRDSDEDQLFLERNPGVDVYLAMQQSPPLVKRLYQNALIMEDQDNYTGAEDIYLLLLSSNVHKGIQKRIFQRLGDIYIKQKKYLKATQHLDQRLALNPRDLWVAKKIPTICQHQESAEPFIELLKKKIANSPDTSSYYDYLSGCYSALGDTAQAANFSSKGNVLRAQLINPVTKNHYIQLVDILRENHIQGVYVQYPLRSLRSLEALLSPEVDIHKSILIDNQESFQEAVAREGYDTYFKDRFAGDFGHCTPKGNHLLAYNVAQGILENIRFR